MGGKPLRLKDRVWSLLKKEEGTLTCREMMDQLSISKRGEIEKALKELEREGKTVRIQGERYVLPEKVNLIPGRIQGHKKGFAFLLPLDPDMEDLFISLENKRGAMHGDLVLVRPSLKKKKKREGVVSRILERKNQTIVGRLERDKRAPFAYLIPDNPRITSHIFVPGDGIQGALHNQKVVVKITSWPTQNRGPEGHVVEVLGFEQEPGVDIEGVIRQMDLPHVFSKEVEEAALAVAKPPTSKDLEERRDLRHLFTFTIDGEDAKDFDDAISLRPKEEGEWELGVHIADVSHYVTPGDVIDVEAQRRGTSVYLLNQVIPMLPEPLSNHICSLKEGEDRLTFSLLITLKDSIVIDYTLERSLIKVKKRLTYKEVNAFLAGETQLGDLGESLLKMYSISQKLRRERMEGGSLDFNFPEVKIILDERGSPEAIEREEHGPGESIIEEFMLLANQKVAHFILEREVPSIFRVHERPQREKIRELNDFLSTLGYQVKTKNGRIHPKSLQRVLFACQGKEEERPISNMILRSLSQARYSPENVGHFGLAIDLYTHFTSPIRRYPDLVIHRILSLIMEDRINEESKDLLESLLPEVAEEASKRERLAMEAEWEVEEIKKVEYMCKKKGEVFSGIISGVINSGFFVELPNTVEGFVRVSTLEDDYYLFNQKQMALIGERRRRVYRLGDRVKILVDRVDLEEREIDFLLIQERA